MAEVALRVVAGRKSLRLPATSGKTITDMNGAGFL
jgi:hypothetical protein